MDCGIITYHEEYNYGAFLQTYCFQKTLRELGMKPKIINYSDPKFLYKKYKRLFYHKGIRILLREIKIFFVFRNMFKKLDKTKRYFFKKSLRNLNFKRIYLGSDEIWNFKYGLIKNEGVFFGNYLPAQSELVAYAPSMESSSYEKIPENFLKGLKKFKKISVRDLPSKNALKQKFKRNIEILPDPVFLQDLGEFKNKDCGYRNFILLYSPMEMIDDKTKKDILDFARQNRKKIISVGFDIPWTDINNVSPSLENFIDLFLKADYIITSMYHGTILCIKFRKNFCSVVTPRRKVKIGSLLKELNLSNRIYSGDISKTLFLDKKDIDKSLRIIKEKNKKARNFLIK